MNEINQNPVSPSGPQGSGPQGSGLPANLAAALCYICGIVSGVIFLLIEKDNKQIKFHAWQSICLGGVGFCLWVISFILAFIPFIGLIFGLVSLLAYVGLFVLMVVSAIKAYQGEQWKIPYIGDFAEQQANK